MIKKTINYFTKPGPDNTMALIDTIVKRIKATKIRTVVVASNSGQTGARFAQALNGKAKVIAISYEPMEFGYKQHVKRCGGLALDRTHLPFSNKNLLQMRQTLLTLGQGFKVAIEVLLIAADKKVITPYKDMIGVGGTAEGADTAVIARATTTREIFSPNKKKRLEIREIIAMPLQKKWW